jgi:hypothetical protein
MNQHQKANVSVFVSCNCCSLLVSISSTITSALLSGKHCALIKAVSYIVYIVFQHTQKQSMCVYVVVYIVIYFCILILLSSQLSCAFIAKEVAAITEVNIFVCHQDDC